MKKSIALVLSLCMFLTLLVGCGGNNSQSSNDTAKDTKAVEQEVAKEKPTEEKDNSQKEEPKEEKTEELKPVVIDNFDHQVTYDKIPEKVVTTELEYAQIMIALGLQDKIVGMATGHNKIEECLPEYQEELKKLPDLGPVPAMEKIVQTGADFMFSSVYTFNGISPYEDFVNSNIQPYVCTGTFKIGATVEDVYEDILNIGRIFRVEDRAEKLVAEMKTRIEETTKNIKKNDNPVKVFVYDVGEKEVLTCGDGVEANIIELAGGQNIFNDQQKAFLNVNWESIVERNPEVIVINDYEGHGSSGYDEKIKFLKNNPALQNIDAIKNNRFIRVSLIEVFPGLQVVDAVDKVHQGLKEFGYVD